MHKRTELGRAGEQLVAHYLEDQGFTILANNYLQRFGEVDLIATKDDVLAFVEVKRRNNACGVELEEIIVPSKQRKIIAVAKEYMMQNSIEEKVCRFDVAFVVGSDDTAEITYIEDAFQEPW